MTNMVKNKFLKGIKFSVESLYEMLKLTQGDQRYDVLIVFFFSKI